jgi:hypothetical protein
MEYYKTEDNKVYAYESEGFQVSWVKPGLIPITEEEARAIVYPPPTPEQLQEQAEYEKRHLMGVAKDKIAPLQYAVDLQMETQEEQAFLLAWKKYCVLLNRVDCSKAPDIDWPKAPE